MQAIRIIEIPDGRMGSIITPPEAAKIMGYHQMDYSMPIKVRCTK